MEYKATVKEINEIYEELKPMVEDAVKRHSKEIDAIIAEIKANVDSLTIVQINSYMLRLQIESFYFSERKEGANLKKECAVLVQELAQADLYNTTEGTQGVRNNLAILGTQDKKLIAILYQTVSSKMKTKLDETHRMIETLKNIGMSKTSVANRDLQLQLHGGKDDLYSNDD